MEDYAYNKKDDVIVISDSRGRIRVLNYERFVKAPDRSRIIDELATDLLDAGWVDDYYRVPFVPC